jgi:hypothetical protein
VTKKKSQKGMETSGELYLTRHFKLFRLRTCGERNKRELCVLHGHQECKSCKAAVCSSCRFDSEHCTKCENERCFHHKCMSAVCVKCAVVRLEQHGVPLKHRNRQPRLCEIAWCVACMLGSCRGKR